MSSLSPECQLEEELIAKLRGLKYERRPEIRDFPNNKARHFFFNADERFLPVHQHTKPDTTKARGLPHRRMRLVGTRTPCEFVRRTLLEKR